MSGGKPTVPEILMGTLTSSDHKFARMSDFTNIRHVWYAMTTLKHLVPFRSVCYMRIVDFEDWFLAIFCDLCTRAL